MAECPLAIGDERRVRQRTAAGDWVPLPPVVPNVIEQIAGEDDIGAMDQEPAGEVDRFSVEIQGRELNTGTGVARQVARRFTAEIASGPRVREISARLQSSEQQCSVVRDELRNVLGQAQLRDEWWRGNAASLESVAHSDACERHAAISMAESAWRQQRQQLENAVGSAENQIGGQQAIINEQAGMLQSAERYVADHGARTQVELSAALQARQNAEERARRSTTLEEQLRSELREA